MSKTALLFSGQGAQTVGMGKDLYQQYPLAKEIFDQANRTLGYDLAGLCFNGPEAELTRTENAQPGIFLVSWVAFQLLRTAVPSLRFDATAGLSLGEFTALGVANALSFEDGLRLVRARGLFMQEACEATRGGMAAILGLDEKPVREVCLEADVELANSNCPGQLVISGEAENINKACELAKTRGATRAKPLAVAGAYHSRLMKSAQPKLKAALEKINLIEPESPVISNVRARPHGGRDEIRLLLIEQVTAPVLWESSMRFLIGEGFTRFIELGPGTTLNGFLKRIDNRVERMNVADAPSLQEVIKSLSVK